MDEDSRKILTELFISLGFSEKEQKKALLDFEKKVATEILMSVHDKLSREQRDFLAKDARKITDPNDARLIPIKNDLKNLHSAEEYQKMSKEILRKLLPRYVDYMGQGMSEENSVRLRKIIARL